MPSSRLLTLAGVALFSLAIAGCKTTSATDGSGYQFVRFTNGAAAVAASQDPTAGPAISSNNKTCKRDRACKK